MQLQSRSNQSHVKSRLIAGGNMLLLCAALLGQYTGVYAAPTHTAQEKKAFIKVAGTVTDEKGQPLAGVSVQQKNSKRGTATDANGRFTLDVEEGSTLVISSTGFATQEVKASNAAIVIALKDDNKTMEEVYVGYQRVRKSDVTGSISSVKAGELNLSTPTLGQALVGKVAGVTVAQTTGAPYGSTKIRVRGVGSVNASSEPLYVIDGYAVGANPVGGGVAQGAGNGGASTNGYNPNATGNDLFINPDDIESIEVLKDAASAAIYGSRASGGVVLITTKRGKNGKGKLTYDYQLSKQQLAKKVKLLNSTQFVDLFVDGRNANYKDILVAKGITWDDSFYSDDNATRATKAGQSYTNCSVCIIKELYDFPTQTKLAPQYNTDWQDVLYDNVLAQRHNLSFSGGTNSTRYMVSGGYLDQPGILNSTYQKRINLRANIDADVTSKLKIASSVFVTNTDNREVQEGRFNQGPILGALNMAPIFPAYKADGTLATADLGAGAQFDGFSYSFQGIENPLALAQRVKIYRKGLRTTINTSATYEIIKNLSFKINLGGQSYTEKYEYYYPTNLSSGINAPGSSQAILAANASASNLNIQDRLAEYTLNYTKQYKKHNINALAGYTAQKTSYDVLSVGAKNFSNDYVQEVTAVGSTAGDFSLQSNNSYKTVNTLVSYLARVMYNYDRRYFVMGSFRRDASSRFGPGNRWGTFGSVSAGWTISNESFYHNWLGAGSTLKLRGSWGLTGNNNIGNYNYQQNQSGAGGTVIGSTVYNGAWAGNIADGKIGWESTSQFNFGVDATTLNNRVAIIANYYISKSYNLLFNRPVSVASGSTNGYILTNLPNSDVRNSGFDLQIDVKAVQGKDFNLNVSGNITANKNEVKSLGGVSSIMVAGAERSYATHITREGSPIGSFYGQTVAGMVRQKDMDNINADLAVYKANGNKFPTGYKLKGVPISTYSTTPLQPGDLYFVDKNGDGIVNDADKDVIKTPYPKFTYGFNISASYKIVDFSASFNGSQGNWVLDGEDYYQRNMEGSGNQYAVVDQRYRNEANPGNGHEYRASRGGSQSNSTRLSDYYLQNGSYFRCTNMTAGVNLNWLAFTKKLGISGLRWYASVDNAFTITKYLGYNPEVDYNNGDNRTPGVNYGKYPLIRSYNTGVQVQF